MSRALFDNNFRIRNRRNGAAERRPINVVAETETSGSGLVILDFHAPTHTQFEQAGGEREVRSCSARERATAAPRDH